MKNKERLKRGLPLIYCWQCQHRGSDISCPMCYCEDYYDEDVGVDFIIIDKTTEFDFCSYGELDEEYLRHEEYCRALEKEENE